MSHTNASLLSLAGLGSWSLDTENNTLHLSDQTRALLGLPENAVLNWEQFLAHFTEDAADLLQQAIKDALQKSLTWDIELSLCYRNGFSPWWRCFGECDKEGNIQALVQEISVAKDVEFQLLETLHQLDSFNYALNQNMLVWIRDLQGRLSHVNQKVCEVSGYARKELLDRVHYFHHLSDYPDNYVRQVHLKVMENQQWRGELLCQNRKGKTYWLDVTTTPILNEKGKITHMVSMGHLITQRKRTEAALHRFEDGLKTLATLQSDFNLSFRHKMNQALSLMKDYFDVDLAFLILPVTDARAQQDYVAAFHQGDLQGLESSAYVEQAMPLIEKNEGQLCVVPLSEQAHSKDDGVAYQVVWGQTLKNAQHKPLGYLTFFDTRTEPLFRIDEDREFFDLFASWLATVIERNDFLERITRSNESKDRLMTVLAHDLRSPLSAVNGFTELLLEQTVLDPTQTLVSHLELIESLQDATRRSLVLIQSILEFERLGEKNYVPRFETLDFKMWLQHHLRVPRMQAERYLLDVQVHFTQAPVFVRLDPPVFSRVVSNVMQNACKFTPSGGTIQVSLDTEMLGDVPMVLLKICDTGIGIPADKIKLVFSREQVIRRPGLRGESSNGMGLAIVKRIVELHQGYLRIESQENKGTCISIMLPRTDESV